MKKTLLVGLMYSLMFVASVAMHGRRLDILENTIKTAKDHLALMEGYEKSQEFAQLTPDGQSTYTRLTNALRDKIQLTEIDTSVLKIQLEQYNWALTHRSDDIPAFSSRNTTMYKITDAATDLFKFSMDTYGQERELFRNHVVRHD